MNVHLKVSIFVWKGVGGVDDTVTITRMRIIIQQWCKDIAIIVCVQEGDKTVD